MTCRPQGHADWAHLARDSTENRDRRDPTCPAKPGWVIGSAPGLSKHAAGL